MNQKQRFFGDRTMPVMLALLSAFPPLSVDLYLPALPHMVEAMNTNETCINMTLSLFLLFFSLGILVWGPVSEKYGRRPIALAGLALYALASFGCALSGNVYQLIVWRVVQAFGGGASTAVSTAMVKDMYSGRQRESVLAIVMAIVVVAPVVAPVMGAMLLKIASWRVIFGALGVIGALVFSLSLLLTETLEERYSGSLIRSIGRLAVVLKNPGFSFLLVVFSLVPVPLLAFIAASSFIYIRDFGLTETVYSCFFAFNALGALVGPLLYIRISERIPSGHIISGCFGIATGAGILLMAWGAKSPVAFALIMGAATWAMSLMRPPTANLLLAQQQKDTGSAASLINFTGMAMGSVGMFMVSLVTGDLISWLGMMLLLMGVVCGALWLWVKNRPCIRQSD